MSETPKNGTARNGAIVFLIVLAGIAGFGAYRHFSASPTAEPPVAPAVKGDAVTTPPASPEAAAGTAATAPAATAATEPARPAAVALSAAPPAFDVVRVLPSGDATIAGRSSPGAEIAIYANGAVIGRTTATENGEWVIVLDRPLSPGEYELTVTSVARGGKSELEGAERVAVSLPQDRKEQPLVAIVSPDQPTRVLQQPKNETEAPQVAISTVDRSGDKITVAGSAGPGAVIKLYVDDQPLGETTAAAGGTFTLTATAAIAGGQHKVRADQVEVSTGKVLARAEVPFDDTVDAAAAPAGSGEKPAEPEMTHFRVVRGDNLWQIAERFYGRGARFTAIYRANKDQIRDPDLIFPGQVFVIPKE